MLSLATRENDGRMKELFIQRSFFLSSKEYRDTVLATGVGEKIGRGTFESVDNCNYTTARRSVISNRARFTVVLLSRFLTGREVLLT